MHKTIQYVLWLGALLSGAYYSFGYSREYFLSNGAVDKDMAFPFYFSLILFLVLLTIFVLWLKKNEKIKNLWSYKLLYGIVSGAGLFIATAFFLTIGFAPQLWFFFPGDIIVVLAPIGLAIWWLKAKIAKLQEELDGQTYLYRPSRTFNNNG